MAKQKMKTKQAIAKRIKVTKTGKFLHAKCGDNHLKMNKDGAHRHAALGKELSVVNAHKMSQLLPYGK